MINVRHARYLLLLLLMLLVRSVEAQENTEVNYGEADRIADSAIVSMSVDSAINHGSFLFPIHKSDVLHNELEINKIRQQIKQVEADTATTLKRLVLKGYSSPDGPYRYNRKLAKNRADSMANFVTQEFPSIYNKVSVEYEPENWEGLIAFITQSDTTILPHRDQLLEIANSDLSPDAKERCMRKRYPADFDYLKVHCLPQLRCTDYFISYERCQYDTLVVPRPLPALTDALAEVEPEPEPEPMFRPRWALKTNLLFDLVLGFNGEVEMPLGRKERFSIMLEVWKPWFVWHHNSRAYQLQVVGLEGRYWFGAHRERRPSLTGLFVAPYVAIGKYDFEWESVGDQGEFTSFGATVGYSWRLRRRLNLELSGSFGTFWGPRRHYNGEYDDTHLIWKYTSTTHYTGPTKLKLSLVWLLGKKHPKGRKEGGL